MLRVPARVVELNEIDGGTGRLVRTRLNLPLLSALHRFFVPLCVLSFGKLVTADVENCFAVITRRERNMVTGCQASQLYDVTKSNSKARRLRPSSTGRAGHRLTKLGVRRPAQRLHHLPTSSSTRNSNAALDEDRVE